MKKNEKKMRFMYSLSILKNNYEWGLVILLIIFCMISYIYGDILTILRDSLIFDKCLVNLDVKNFFKHSVMDAGHSSSTVYEIPVFLIIGILNFPIYLAMGNNYNFVNSPLALVWVKLSILLFVILTAYVIKKILDEINIDHYWEKVILFCFFTSLAVIFPSLLITQIEIISILFSLLGVLYYLKNDNKKFLFWFAIAIPIKNFALFIFFPLLLLKEKNILKIFIKTFCAMSLFLICRFYFSFDIYYNMVHQLFYHNRFLSIFGVQIKENIAFYGVGIPLFIVFYTLLCAFCYYYKFDDTKNLNYRKKLIFYILYLTYQLIFLFILAPHPYWYVLNLPFMLLVISQNKEKFILNNIIELVTSTMYFILCCFSTPWVFANTSMKNMPLWKLPKTDLNLNKFSSFSDILIELKIDNYKECILGVYIALILFFIIINFPKKDNFDDNIVERKDIKYKKHILLSRFLPVLFFFIIAVISFTSKKPINIYNSLAQIKKENVTDIFNSELKEIITFSDSLNLESMNFYVNIPSLSYTDYCFIGLSVEDISLKEKIYNKEIALNNIMKYNDKITFNLKNLKVLKNHQYEFKIYGKDFRQVNKDEIKIGLTDQQISEFPLVINNKQISKSLLMDMVIKNTKYLDIRKINNLNVPNAEITEISFKRDLYEDSLYRLNIKVKNLGMESWYAENSINLNVYLDNKLLGRAYIRIADIIKNNDTYTFLYDIRKNEISDNEFHILSFQMCQEGNCWFGNKKEIKIKVQE